jgi:diguanylate cyclase (GGDEF) domain
MGSFLFGSFYFFAVLGDRIAIITAFIVQCIFFWYFGCLYTKLHKKVRTDFLTGLKNREEFHGLTKNNFQNNSLSMLMIDVDNFREINNKYGHQEGDKALIALSTVFQQQVREDDTVIRWGGDEFIVVLPNTGTSTAIAIAERIKEAVSLADIHSVTVSIGIADTEKSNFQEAFCHADEALYKAKIVKNTVAVYDSPKS